MPNEFVIQAPTNSLQLSEKRQAEFTYSVFNASGVHCAPRLSSAPLRRAAKAGSVSRLPNATFPSLIRSSTACKTLCRPQFPAGTYTFALDMLWEGAGEPEQRTVAGSRSPLKCHSPLSGASRGGYMPWRRGAVVGDRYHCWSDPAEPHGGRAGPGDDDRRPSPGRP